MKNQPALPDEKPVRNIPLLVTGFLLLLLIGAGVWYFANTRGATISVPTITVLPEETEPNEAPAIVPEEAPEQEPPSTFTPSFRDNFDNGLDPVWAVIYGDPFVENGQLTSNVGAGIAAGAPSWKDYRIEFDVDASQVECEFGDSSNSIGVRVTDFDHAYWFVLTSCRAAWSAFAGGLHEGTPSLFPETQVELSTAPQHITIEVEGTKMSAYANGTPLSSIMDASSESGGIFVQIEARTFYDNFEVTLLP